MPSARKTACARLHGSLGSGIRRAGPPDAEGWR